MCGYYGEKLHVSHFWELKCSACYKGSSLFLIKLISFGSSLQNPWPNDTVLATLNQKLFAEGVFNDCETKSRGLFNDIYGAWGEQLF